MKNNLNLTFEEKFRKRKQINRSRNFLIRILCWPYFFVLSFLFGIKNFFRYNNRKVILSCICICLFFVYSSIPNFFVENESLTDKISDEAKQIQFVEDEETLDEEILRLLSQTDNVTDIEDEEIEEILLSEEDILNVDLDRISQIIIPDENEDYSDYVFDKNDWRLILVNKQNSIPEDYKVTLGYIYGKNDGMRCDERILDELFAMIQAAKEDGVSLVVRSPYRDLDYQTRLFQRKVDSYMRKGVSYIEAYQLAGRTVTLPGCSEHQLGLAMDIVTDTYTLLKEEFADTNAGKWLAANSYKYGFILRYPKGKQFITGISYEPWHFRYVGVEAATVITKKGITLEEFWEDL